MEAESEELSEEESEAGGDLPERLVVEKPQGGGYAVSGQGYSPDENPEPGQKDGGLNAKASLQWALEVDCSTPVLALLVASCPFSRNSTYLDDHGPPPSKVLPFPSQVVYNRVGKCGSRTVVLLLRILSEKHGFNLVTSDIHNKTRLTKNEQMELIKNISTAEQPYLFTRHVHFLNFSRFGGDQPVYINIIRDPVNRFLSNYFFRRFGDWRGEQNHMIRTPSMRQEERYLDINECILENYPECSNPRLFYIIPYFCGQHPRCREPGEWALERAKLNVNENFLLVGILEELEDVLLLLERFLPHYFKGVLSIYKDPEHRKLGNMTVTVRKTVPSPEAVQILYQRMRYEYEFYHYVKEQFHLLKRKFGLKSQVSQPPLRPQFFIPSPLETEEPIGDEEQDDEKWLEDIYKSPERRQPEDRPRQTQLAGCVVQTQRQLNQEAERLTD
ncbi:uronyl 2-sulfotransferase [Myotis lucifugus]|uniref:uronyl 2-sulfotransferase n=1 Tax=Myotis lucifugus TaxID=59463 RepID=UPI0006D72EC2|nr:uronyl 2-sulfotransferase [Myotis lucifugus]